MKDAATWPFESEQYLLPNVAINNEINPATFSSSEKVIDYVQVYQEGSPAHSFNQMVQMLPNGVLLIWTPTPGAVGCQVRGGLLGGADVKSFNVLNNDPLPFCQRFKP